MAINNRPNRYDSRRDERNQRILDTRPGQKLPSDIESEEALIGAILQSPNRVYDVLTILPDATCFYNKHLGRYYEAILQVLAEGKQLRALTVIQAIIASGNEEPLTAYPPNHLTMTGLNLHIAETARHIKMMWTRREVIAQCGSMLAMAFGGGAIHEIITLSSQTATLLTSGISASKTVTMSRAVDDAEAAFEAVLAKNGELTGVPTGLRELDFVTGGWQADEVIVIAAEPGAGKTVFLCNNVLKAAQKGYPCGMANCEMGPISLVNRFVSALTGIPYKWIATGYNQYTGARLTEHQIEAIRAAKAYLRTLPIYFYEGENDVADLLLQVEDWVRRYGIRLMAFDYLQIILDREIRGGDDTARISSVSRKIKVCQRKLQIPFLEASQFNRDKANGGRPTMRNLKGSSQIEQDASVIISMDRTDLNRINEEKDKAKAQGRAPEHVTMTHQMFLDILKYRTGGGDHIESWEDTKTNRLADEAPADWKQHIADFEDRPSFALSDEEVEEVTQEFVVTQIPVRPLLDED